jgi:hypothetical protein
MTALGKDDVVRATADIAALFGDRIIPAGTKGVVLEVYSDGTCYVEFTFRPQTSDEDGDFLQAEVSPDQLETAGT